VAVVVQPELARPRIHVFLRRDMKVMFRRRAAAYRQMGYRFEIDESLGRASLWRQLGLFDGASNSSVSPAG
jgi:hypothetical protein